MGKTSVMFMPRNLTLSIFSNFWLPLFTTFSFPYSQTLAKVNLSSAFSIYVWSKMHVHCAQTLAHVEC